MALNICMMVSSCKDSWNRSDMGATNTRQGLRVCAGMSRFSGRKCGSPHGGRPMYLAKR